MSNLSVCMVRLHALPVKFVNIYYLQPTQCITSKCSTCVDFTYWQQSPSSTMCTAATQVSGMLAWISYITNETEHGRLYHSSASFVFYVLRLFKHATKPVKFQLLVLVFILHALLSLHLLVAKPVNSDLLKPVRNNLCFVYFRTQLYLPISDVICFFLICCFEKEIVWTIFTHTK